MKPGLGFLGGPDLRSLVEIGRAAEEAGFESLWHAETRITRDSVTALTALITANTIAQIDMKARWRWRGASDRPSDEGSNARSRFERAMRSEYAPPR